MSNNITAFLLLFSTIAFGQQKVELRDLSFNVPAGWQVMGTKEYAENFRSVKYEKFNEVGALYSDKYEVIKYQYYEIPGLELRHLDSIFTDEEKILRKDFKLDTVVAVNPKDYMYARISHAGAQIFYGFSVGGNGVLHLQAVVDKDNPQKSFKVFESIVNSIQHRSKYVYSNKYEEYKNEGAESSKMVIIFGGMAIIVYLISGWVKKANKKHEEQV